MRISGNFIDPAGDVIRAKTLAVRVIFGVRNDQVAQVDAVDIECARGDDHIATGAADARQCLGLDAGDGGAAVVAFESLCGGWGGTCTPEQIGVAIGSITAQVEVGVGITAAIDKSVAGLQQGSLLGGGECRTRQLTPVAGKYLDIGRRGVITIEQQCDVGVAGGNGGDRSRVGGEVGIGLGCGGDRVVDQNGIDGSGAATGSVACIPFHRGG